MTCSFRNCAWAFQNMHWATFYWLNCFLVFHRCIKWTNFLNSVKPFHKTKTTRRIFNESSAANITTAARKKIGKFSSKLIIRAALEAVVKACSEETYFRIVSNPQLSTKISIERIFRGFRILSTLFQDTNL